MSGSNVYLPGKWKNQTFTIDGTFNVPTGVTSVFVEMYGGGAGGPSPANGGVALNGGQGAKPVTTFVPVTPGASISITIGQGGNGAPSGATVDAGSPGGDTSFGSVIARGANNTSFSNDNGERGVAGANTASANGGAGAYGNGGAGGASVGATGGNGGIGAGGGAGGAGAGNGGAGGDGGDGICIVWYRVN